MIGMTKAPIRKNQEEIVKKKRTLSCVKSSDGPSYLGKWTMASKYRLISFY